MNVCFVGIRENEDKIISGPKKVSNCLYNRLIKKYSGIYYYGLPWEENEANNIEHLDSTNEYEAKGSMIKIPSFLRKNKIDVVYLARYYSILALFLVLLKPFYGYKIAYTVHGIIKKEKRINKSFKFYGSWLEAFLLRNTDAIVVITEGQKKELLYYYPWLKDKDIHVINNGVSLAAKTKRIDIKSLYNLDPNKKVIFTVGTRRIKNIEDIVDAFIGSEAIYSNSSLVIAGEDDTEYAKYLIEKCKDFNNIKFIGYVDPNLMNNIYSQCDFYVQLSEFETFGMAIVEAMLHKKNVLINSELPIADYFTDEEVFKYNKKDDNLSDIFLSILSDKDGLNIKGYEKARSLFDWEEISEKYYKVFYDLS